MLNKNEPEDETPRSEDEVIEEKTEESSDDKEEKKTDFDPVKDNENQEILDAEIESVLNDDADDGLVVDENADVKDDDDKDDVVKDDDKKSKKACSPMFITSIELSKLKLNVIVFQNQSTSSVI